MGGGGVVGRGVTADAWKGAGFQAYAARGGRGVKKTRTPWPKPQAPNRMNLLKCWYNRLLFSRFEYRASLRGPRRAAMAVAPPWGMVLLRPGPPGPMPTL